MRNVFKLVFPAEAPLDTLLVRIGSLDYVRSVEKNWIPVVEVTPNDTAFTYDYNWGNWHDGRPDQWAYLRMQVDRAWNITRGSSDVIVAIIDTGVDWEHPDLEDNLWINSAEDANHNGHFDNYPSAEGGDLNGDDDDENGLVDDVIGWDFWLDSNNPTHWYPNQDDHGTMMASYVAATTDNVIGVAGISWHTRLMVLKVGDLGHILGGTVAVYDAIRYAQEKGADIVNMSFGWSDDCVDSLHCISELIHKADSTGVLFVASARGTQATEIPTLLNSIEEVVSVTMGDSAGYDGFCGFGIMSTWRRREPIRLVTQRVSFNSRTR